MTLLSVSNLQVGFLNENNKRFENVVHGIDFTIEAGKTLALVGESGSGKSVSAMSLVRLLPANKVRIVADAMCYQASSGQGIDLLVQTPKQMQAIRGGDIAVIFQDPLISLNPVHRIYRQIQEMFRLHRPDITKKDYQQATLHLLERVGMKKAEEVARAYPHQLSGGMRQRVMIAIALAGRPKLLIADEPTTALDVTIQAQILALLQELQQEYGMSMLFISHDLAVVRALAHRIAVMQNGQIVEKNETEMLINYPKHDYTNQLLSASRLVRNA